jgi:transcriptional regulator GlxA family with amidase domain
MPYETWRRRFREATGLSPGRYRLRRQLEAAESMLRLTQLTVREVAVSAGFADEHHLARHLRARTGLTPRQYRHRAWDVRATAADGPGLSLLSSCD